MPVAGQDAAGAQAGGGDTATPPAVAPPLFNFQQRREQQNQLNLQPPVQGPSNQSLLRAIFSGGVKLPNLSTIPPGTDVTEQPTTQSGQPPQVQVDQLPIDTEGALRTEGAINPSSVPSIQEILQRLQSGATQTADMQRVFKDAMQRWVQEKATGVRDQLFYGPKKVKTQTIVSPTPKVAPANPMSGGGLPMPKQPPLVLVPNKKQDAPAFSGPVAGQPGAGTVVAPPISGGPKTIPGGGGGGIPKVADPSSPNGYRYLTPEEVLQQQQQQQPVVEDQQPVE